MRDGIFNSQLNTAKVFTLAYNQLSGFHHDNSTAATRHIRTANFWADFRKRIVDRAINQWQHDRGPVTRPKDCISNTCPCNCEALITAMATQTPFSKRVFEQFTEYLIGWQICQVPLSSEGSKIFSVRGGGSPPNQGLCP